MGALTACGSAQGLLGLSWNVWPRIGARSLLGRIKKAPALTGARTGALGRITGLRPLGPAGLCWYSCRNL
jgi:hypothetical protein